MRVGMCASAGKPQPRTNATAGMVGARRRGALMDSIHPSRYPQAVEAWCMLTIHLDYRAPALACTYGFHGKGSAIGSVQRNLSASTRSPRQGAGYQPAMIVPIGSRL